MAKATCETCIHDGEDCWTKNSHCSTCIENRTKGGGATGYEAVTAVMAANDDPKDAKYYFDAHYGGTIQPLEFMQAQMEPEEFRGFLKGNIIKYVARCGKKDDPVKEVTKIIRYAEWLKESYDGKTVDPRK